MWKCFTNQVMCGAKNASIFYFICFKLKRGKLLIFLFSESRQFMTVQHVLQMEILFNPGNTCGYAFLIALLCLVQWKRWF